MLIKFNKTGLIIFNVTAPHMDPAVVMAHPMAPAPAGIPSNAAYPQGNNVEGVFHSAAAAGEQVQQVSGIS